MNLHRQGVYALLQPGNIHKQMHARCVQRVDEGVAAGELRGGARRAERGGQVIRQPVRLNRQTAQRTFGLLFADAGGHADLGRQRVFIL